MTLILLLLGFLPGFAWLVFYLGEEDHPEPNRLILFTFVTGIAFGFFAVILEKLFTETSIMAQFGEFSIVSLIGLALIEETMKFAAAYFAVGKSPAVADPVDVMIYMIVAALGFATLENIGALVNISLQTATGIVSQTALATNVLETLSLRFVGATLLHSLTSAVVGYHWALGITRKKVGWYLIFGVILATALHAVFNSLILNYGNIAYVAIFLLLLGFFVLNDFEKLRPRSEN